MENVLRIQSREEFRNWLEEHHEEEKECWILCQRGRPKADGFYYLDAVEEALCFGWIDSTVRKVDHKRYQRFSPRRKNSIWTELNKERVRRLERLGLMREAGRIVCPKMGPRSFQMDSDLVKALKEARVYTKFKRFPFLYQRVRAYNVTFYKHRNPQAYQKALDHLIEMTRQNKIYGEWNDYGRLLED